MNILIVSGFLGAGKTTLILSAVEGLPCLSRRKIAVLVNDFGRIGIDGKLMQKHGLKVKEIASGCICCTMGANLLSSIRAVSEAFAPGLIVIEPSGVADPGAIKSLLASDRGASFAAVKTVVLVDALRHRSISRALGPLVRKQLEAADLILVNKVDEAGQEEIDAIEGDIRGMGIRAPLLPASARRGDQLGRVIALMGA